jgi:SAM domain (Sterile alpha motif)
MDIVVWLRSVGLGKYEALFRENDIDDTVLLSLTAEDLKELGRHVLWAPPQARGCNRCSPQP